MRQLSVIEEKFFQLLQSAVGKNNGNLIELSDDEWASIYQMALEQSLLGVAFDAVERLGNDGLKPPLDILYQWIGEVEIIRRQNLRQNQLCEQLTAWFKSKGYRSCVLKGQGVARLYDEPDLRQPGDIDIWVDASRDSIVNSMRSDFLRVTCVDYVNCHAEFFSDTDVEVHFRPTYMFNPFTNRKVQKWIRDNKETQLLNADQSLGFSYPTIGFNLVFSLIHIYRHIFLEGIGLRQLMDYYCILSHSNVKERNEALTILQSFGLNKFVGSVMFVLQKVFGMDSSFLLCEVNTGDGSFLLSEILQGGNFGQFDDRNRYVSNEQKVKKAAVNIKRNMRFLKHYPSEVVWMPIFKIWHWCWRKYKEYL